MSLKIYDLYCVWRGGVGGCVLSTLQFLLPVVGEVI